MSDANTRELERKAALGDDVALQRLKQARYRAKQCIHCGSQERLAAANSHLGERRLWGCCSHCYLSSELYRVATCVSSCPIYEGCRQCVLEPTKD